MRTGGNGVGAAELSEARVERRSVDGSHEQAHHCPLDRNALRLPIQFNYKQIN
jgi:hypothetical protein